MSTGANRSMAGKIWRMLSRTERRSAIGLSGMMFVSMLLETLSIGAVIPALILLTQGNLTRKHPGLQPILDLLGNPTHEQLIVGGMLLLVGVYLFKTLFQALLIWRQMRFSFGVQSDLSQRLFTTYLRQPYAFHLRRNSAELILNVINEVRLFADHGIQPALLLVTEVLVLIGLCSLLLAVEPLGTMIAVSVMGAAAWGFHRFTRARIARWGEARQVHDTLRMQHLQQGLGSAKEVKLLGREDDFLERYRTHNMQAARIGERQMTLLQLPRLWLELLAVVGLAMLVITMLAQGRSLDVVLPTLGLFGAAAFRLTPSANRILGALQSLRFSRPAVDLLGVELSLPASEPLVSREPRRPLANALELRQVTYVYEGAEDPAVTDVSLDIQRGELIGFVGASGAGKSTLVDIILGLLTPTSGSVVADGRDIREDPRNWQDQIGYVPQSIFLTDDSLRRNVAFGLADKQIDDAALRRAIRAAQLEELVASLPEGVETVVGERGVRLSGGQRQRIGIARALYHNPAVLVLDEATSSLDMATERGVMKAVTALHGEKTILIVAHRLSTVARCDRLYKLEGGRIVEVGTPASVTVAVH